MRLIAARGSRRAFEVRDLLERNLLPVRWYDVDTDDESARDARVAGHPARGDAGARARHQRDAQPVGRAGRALARACARRSTASASTSSCSAPGRPGWPPRSTAARRACGRSWPRRGRPAARPGRARGSRTTSASRVGISGVELTRKATLQARRFDAVLSSFHSAVELADGPEGLVRVDLDDGQHVLARTVVMATGATWRELQAEGVDRFRGAGVYHAAMATDAERCRGEDVIVVGGGNSAGRRRSTSPRGRAACAWSCAARR
jgi:thioredoxin reductase (NADPH)